MSGQVVAALRPPDAVRHMLAPDRAAILAIAAETGFFGEPIDAVMDSPALFTDLLYSYYVDLEPVHAWVAEEYETVVGFVVGTADSRAMRARWLAHVVPGIVMRILRGEYNLGPLSRHWLSEQLAAAVRAEAPPVSLAVYPAHLHVNVRAGSRGRGLGRRLVSAFLAQLSEEGVHGVHLRTTSRNLAACHLYESLGFRLLGERPTRAWQDVIDVPVANRAYGLLL